MEGRVEPIQGIGFADLRTGGQALAKALAGHHNDRNAVVLGIVRGGVPAAFEVAHALGVVLDVVLVRTLIKRASGEWLRAARVAGTPVMDAPLEALATGSIERVVVSEGVRELAEREARCRGARPATCLAGRTVLLIDNGMRTGQTMAAAIRAVRTMNPARIVAAAPVGTPSATTVAGALADQLHCLVTSDMFGNVAMGYRRFDVPDEARCRTLLDRA